MNPPTYWIQYRVNGTGNWINGLPNGTAIYSAQTAMDHMCSWKERLTHSNPDAQWRWHPSMFEDLKADASPDT